MLFFIWFHANKKIDVTIVYTASKFVVIPFFFVEGQKLLLKIHPLRVLININITLVLIFRIAHSSSGT